MAKGPRGLVEKREAAEKRKLYSRVLIVCEGMKTEPLYLSDLRDELKAPTINCEVVGEGRDPSAVVKRAVEHAESPDGDYDYVFCVFDRDKHEHYADACERCRNVEVKRRGGTATKLVAITTNPSFEYWLLLHLDPTTKPYRQAGNRTSGDQAFADFSKAYLKETGVRYAKGTKGVYGALKPKLEAAIKFADRENREGISNPHSLVGALITILRNIAAGKDPDIKAIQNIPRANEAA